MIPFTTPKHTFRLGFSASLIEEARIVYQQNGEVVLEKTLDDCTKDGNSLILKLTQAETGLFRNNMKVSVQIHLRTTDGEVVATKPKRIDVDEILKPEVL